MAASPGHPEHAESTGAAAAALGAHLYRKAIPTYDDPPVNDRPPTGRVVVGIATIFHSKL